MLCTALPFLRQAKLFQIFRFLFFTIMKAEFCILSCNAIFLLLITCGGTCLKKKKDCLLITDKLSRKLYYNGGAYQMRQGSFFGRSVVFFDQILQKLLVGTDLLWFCCSCKCFYLESVTGNLMFVGIYVSMYLVTSF